MTRYQVTFDVEVADEDSGHFQPGSRDAWFVGTDMHAVGSSDDEAVHMLIMFAMRGRYDWEQWGNVKRWSASISTPPCEIERVEETALPDGQQAGE